MTQHICAPRTGISSTDAKLNSRRELQARRSTTRRATDSVHTTTTLKFNRWSRNTCTSECRIFLQNPRNNKMDGQVSYTTFAILQQYKYASRMHYIHNTALNVLILTVSVLICSFFLVSSLQILCYTLCNEVGMSKQRVQLPRALCLHPISQPSTFGLNSIE